MTTSRTEPGMSAIANAGFSLADEAGRMRRRLIAHIEAGGTTDPVTAPQAVDSYPQTKFLRIERFVLRASPNAEIADVYVFFDQLKILTDDYEVNFDGQELHRAFDKGNSGAGSTTQQK